MRAQLALGTVKCWHPRGTLEQLQTNHTRPARRPVAQEGIGGVSRVQVDPRDGQEQEEVLRRQGRPRRRRVRSLGRGRGAGQGIRGRVAQELRHSGRRGEVRGVSPRARVRDAPPLERRGSACVDVRLPGRGHGRGRTRGWSRGRRRSAGSRTDDAGAHFGGERSRGRRPRDRAEMVRPLGVHQTHEHRGPSHVGRVWRQARHERPGRRQPPTDDRLLRAPHRI